MGEYMLEQKVKLLCGPGKASETGALAAMLGKKKALLVTDKGIIATGIHNRVVDSLEQAGIGCVIFDGVVPDPTAQNVADGYKMCADHQCDLVIGMGGGSPMDTSKAINLLRFNPEPILRYADPQTSMEPAPGLIVIPTTSGTGSEMSDGLVISSDGVKHPILAPAAGAQYAVIDPELMVGIPPRLTQATGLDALSHAMEGYTSTAADTATDIINESLMRTIVEWLPKAVENGGDVEARQQMAVCASIAGWMLQYSHTNAGHSIAHILGSHYHIPHGEACAYATPWVLEFNAAAMPDRVMKIGRILGASFKGGETPEEIGAIARDAFIHFCDVTLGKLDITRYEVDKATFSSAADDIAGELFQVFNPRKMEPADALDILNKIFA